MGVLALAWFGAMPWAIGWRVAAFAAAAALVQMLLERRGFRGSGTATLFALVDASLIAMATGSALAIDRLGFLVLVPCAYAIARFGASSALLAPISVSLLVVAHNLFQRTPMEPTTLAQFLGILTVGLLLNQGRVVLTIERPPEVPAESPVLEPEPSGFLELRENFRRLRDHCINLERRSQRDQLTASLVDAMFASGDRLPQRLSHRLRELAGVEGLVLATAAQTADSMVVRAVSGEVDTPMRTVQFPIPTSWPEVQVRQAVNDLLKTLPSATGRSQSGNVVLKAHGRVIGVACLTDHDPKRLSEGLERAEAASGILGKLLFEDLESESLRYRTRCADLLYAVATVTAGSATPASLASRVVRELGELAEVDHLGVWMRDGDSAVPLASSGARCALLDAMSFAAGPGLVGWYGVGMPELWLFDTGDDARCPRAEAVKRRTGSFLAIPISFDEVPFGYLTAATHRAGGLDLGVLELLRTLAAEMGQALARLQGVDRGGLATPTEFQAAVAEAGDGCLVVLEPLRRMELTEQYGAPVVETALRTLSRRVRGRLPAHAFLCRRTEGDLVAFLPGCAEPFARQWANEVATLASMIGVGSPDGRSRVPLGLRARVAAKTPYSNQVPDVAVN